MGEFIPGICWQEFPTTNQTAVNALNNAGFKALRIFFNLRDLPKKSESTSWQGYIQYLFNTMPNGLHTFMFEGHPSVNSTTEPMRATFDFCKKYKWLPIVCMGTSEESVSGEWIGRVPTDWNWIGRFIKEFAIYLHDIYKFDRADMEVWNEPSKVFEVQTYCDIALIMARAWTYVSNYKVHVFSDDLLRQNYLDSILLRSDLMKEVHYISTHIGVGSEDDEWERNLIAQTTNKIAKYPHLKQALTEMSVNGIWSRLNQLPNYVAMYGIIGAIRNEEFGTATRIDDIWMWDIAGNLQCTSPTKAQTLKDFNTTYYKPYTLESNDMELENFYYRNRPTYLIKRDPKGYGIAFLRKCFGLSHGFTYDMALENKVKEYQSINGLLVDGKVGQETFGNMILKEDYYKFYCWAHSLWARNL